MEERSFSGSGERQLDGVVRTKLLFSWLRSTGAIQRALLERFPDEASWMAALADPALEGEVAGFQDIIAQIRAAAQLGAVIDLDRVEQAGSVYYEAALDSIKALADRLGVNPADLLVTLVHA